MKFLVLILCCLFLSGCYVQGQGSTIGYVTTIEDTSFFYHWDTVWFRVETGTYSSMQSQPEEYAILDTDTVLKEQLLDTCRKNQKIELIFDRHIELAHRSARGVVKGFKIINK